MLIQINVHFCAISVHCSTLQFPQEKKEQFAENKKKKDFCCLFSPLFVFCDQSSSEHQTLASFVLIGNLSNQGLV